MHKRETAAGKMIAWIANPHTPASFVTAAAMLACAALTGWAMGLGMMKWGYRTLQTSEVFASMVEKTPAGLKDDKRMMQSPQNMELFVDYLNALAPVVNNMELLPGRQISSFGVISDAAWATGITLDGFSLDANDQMRLTIAAHTANADKISDFVKLLSQNEGFAEIDAPMLEKATMSTVGQHFTITCTFSPLF